MVFAESLVITHLVPLVTLGGSKDRKIIIGAESFKDRICEGNPETSREFRNSMGKCTASDSSSTESSDRYSTDSPGNCATNVALIVRVVSLRGAKMHRSESQVIFLKFESKSGYTLVTSLSTLHANVPIFSAAELYLGQCLWDTYHLQWPIADQQTHLLLHPHGGVPSC